MSRLSAACRRELRSTVNGAIGRDLYGPGSSPVREERDRRDVDLAGPGAVQRHGISRMVPIVTILRFAVTVPSAP
ncbi:hypothetical protein ACWGR4_30215 [Embleya sp. NPDC055664]